MKPPSALSDQVVEAPHHSHDVESQPRPPRREVLLVPHLLGRHRRDGDLVADVDAEDLDGRLVHDHLVETSWIRSATANDPISLDLRSDPSVARRPDREVGLDAIDDREHDREPPEHVDHRQLRDLFDDLRVDRAHIGQDVRGTRDSPRDARSWWPFGALRRRR